MFLSKHKNGINYLYYYDDEGRRNKISTKSKLKNEAYNFLSKFDSIQKSNSQPKLKTITLKKYFFEFLIYSESIHSQNTSNTFKTTFNSVVNYFGDISISSLTHLKIREFIQFKIKTVSKYQVRKDLINLSSAFNKAVSYNYLSVNPCNGIKRIKITEKQPSFFTETEFEKLVCAIDNKDIRDLTIFAVNTGLRQMELLILQWEQINFRDKLLTLDNRNHLTKSKKIRSIPLNISSMQILVEREITRINSNVFTYHEKIITQDVISKQFKKYVKKVDENSKLNFHSLRHTFASWLVQKGVSIYQVSKLLGHADIKTTEIYAHLRADDFRNAVQRLAD